MATELELHPIQSDILLVLLFKSKARFSDLNTSKVSSDHFNFHLKRLLEGGLIQKSGKTYELTGKGKEFANRFDTDSLVLERQAKVSVLVCGTKHLSGETFYLMQKRLKEPYFGYLGMITGKIRWGEEILRAGARELKEETGLTGKPELVGVKHKMDYDPKGDILEDKFFFVLRIDNLKGKLKTKVNGGENKWMTEREVLASKNIFGDVKITFEVLKSKNLIFIEEKYKVTKY